MEFYIGTANFAKNYGYKRSIISKTEIIKIIKYLKKKKNLKLDTSFSYDKFFKYSNILNLQNSKISTKIFFKKSNFEKKYIYEIKKKLKKIKKKSFDFILVQAPLNLFDRRFADNKIIKFLKKRKIKFQARSIFLQGILLEESKQKLNKLNFKNSIFKKFTIWCSNNKISKYNACVNFIKDQKFINSLVVGIENLDDLIVFYNNIFSRNKKLYPKDIFTYNTKLIDPRKWKTK